MTMQQESMRSWLSRRRKERMTIGAGFLGSEGILLCADTKVAYSGSAKSNASKILKSTFGAENPETAASVLVVVAGPLKYARMAVLDCFQRIYRVPRKGRSIQAIYDQFKIGLNEFHKTYIYPHPTYAKDKDSLLIQTVIGVQHKEKLALFCSQETAVDSVDSNYESIGRGFYLADFLMHPLRDDIAYMGMKDLSLWATHMLMAVKAYDDNCGGWSELQSLGKDGSISRTSYFEISVGEKYTERYDRATRKVFTAAMSPSSSEIQFRNAMSVFNTEMWKVRESLQERKLEYEQMFRILTKRLYDPNAKKPRR